MRLSRQLSSRPVEQHPHFHGDVRPSGLASCAPHRTLVVDFLKRTRHQPSPAQLRIIRMPDPHPDHIRTWHTATTRAGGDDHEQKHRERGA